MYLADAGGDRLQPPQLQVWGADGILQLSLGLKAPYEVASGETLMVVSNGNTLKRLGSDGSLTPLLENTPLLNPGGIAIDSQGHIDVSDTVKHQIFQLNPDGQIKAIAGSGQKGDRDGRSLWQPTSGGCRSGGKHLCG